MLSLVDKYRERYQQAERKEKHDIVEEVMGIISGSGGRFLRRVDYENYWIEVTHSIAYRKVGHAFRSKARKNNCISKIAPLMTRERIEQAASSANGSNSISAVEDMLLADLRLRRAAMHQADFSNMNNLTLLAAQAPALERLLLSSIYTNLAAAGLLQAGMFSPEDLLCQQNRLAVTAALMGGNAASVTSAGGRSATMKETVTAAQQEAAADVPALPVPTRPFQLAANVA